MSNNSRNNTFGKGLKSPMGACSQAAMLGAREGRSTTGMKLDWKQKGRDPLNQILTDSGKEANRLWDLKHGIVAPN